ncbi:unnamed protein product, partial [Tetraodon nigroviridis]
ESCLQINLVYQQVVQEALDKLEILLSQNEKQQKEAESQLSGPIKEPHREAGPTSSYQLPANMFLGRFLKPYFKDKLTGLVRQTGGNRQAAWADRQTGRQTDRQAGRQTGRQADRQTGRQTGRQADRQAGRQTGRQTDRQTGRQTGRQTDRQAGRMSRQADRQADRQAGRMSRQADRQTGRQPATQTFLFPGATSQPGVQGQEQQDDWLSWEQESQSARASSRTRSPTWRQRLKCSGGCWFPRQRSATSMKMQLKKLFVGVQREEGEGSDRGSLRGTGLAEDLQCGCRLMRFLCWSWRSLLGITAVSRLSPAACSQFEGTRDADDLRCFWQNFLHPSINKSGWSQEEVHTLKQLSRKYQERQWESIAEELGTGRTAFMCLQTFQAFASDSLKRCTWTPAEDALLKELVEKMRIGNFIPYTQMSYFMESREPAQLIYRWNNVLDPSLRKGPWTPEEDQVEVDVDGDLVLRQQQVLGQKKKVHKSAKRRKWRKQAGAQKKLDEEGPPANQESRDKSSRMTGCLGNRKVKVKRWESWQKTLLIHSVSRDSLRRLIQPKLSKVDYLSQKLLSAAEGAKQQLQDQITNLETEIEMLREKKEKDLIGDRYVELDWQKISNVDFEGTRDADDLRCFWQNFLHPSINKSGWSQEEVHTLKQLSRKYQERQWESIAEELGTGRTAFMCLQTFQRFASDSLKRCTWTPAEDALLKELVEKMRIGNFIPYTQMSYFMESREPAQLIYRWNNVLDPSLRKGPWTPEEDQLLLRAVSRYGEKDWWKIRMEVPGRHDGACRDRSLGKDRSRDSSPYGRSVSSGVEEAEQKLRVSCSGRGGRGRRPCAEAAAGPRTGVDPRRAASGLHRAALPPNRVPVLPPGAGDGAGAHHGAGPVRALCGHGCSSRGAASAPVLQLLRPHGHLRAAAGPPGPAGQQVPGRRRPPEDGVRAEGCGGSVAPPSNGDSGPRKSPEGPTSQGGAEEARSRSGWEGRPHPGSSVGAVGGKRLRKPSQRARAFQEAARAKAEAKRRRSSPPFKKRPDQVLLARRGRRAGQAVWVMTPLVQLEQAPPPGVPLTLVQRPAQAAPPLVFVADPAVAPPLRKKPRFEPSLMFLQSADAVAGWLGGRRGVLVSRGGVALPYLPPFVSSLKTLGLLLRARSSLTKASLQLLRQGLEASCSQSRPLGPSSTNESLAQVPDPPEPPPGRSFRQPGGVLPGTRALLQPPGSQVTHCFVWAGSSISSNLQQQEQQQQEEEEEEEERLVLAVRQLVAERFSSNPAYQLLRARFLSCFTLPALLASIQPPPERTAPRKTSQQEQEEEEEEEEEEEPKPKKTSKREHLWRAEVRHV